jgi:hypothetical protein
MSAISLLESSKTRKTTTPDAANGHLPKSVEAPKRVEKSPQGGVQTLAPDVVKRIDFDHARLA